MRSVGKGTVEPRGKDKWRLRVSVADDRGKRIRLDRTVECRTKTEAKRALDLWRMELVKSEETLVIDKLTLAEYLEDYLVYQHDVKHASPNTLSGYRDIVRLRWTPRIGDRPLPSITPDEIEKQLAWMQKEGGKNSKPLSGNTCRKALGFLRTALKRAKNLGYIRLNPCDYIDGPAGEKGEIRVLTEDEVIRMKLLLKGHPDYRFSMAALLALDTGMRRGELCGLLWRDVDLEHKRIHVCNAIAEASVENTYNGSRLQDKAPKSDMSNRWITLSDSTVDALREHAERQYYRLMYNDVLQTADTPVLCDDLGEYYRPGKLTSDTARFAQQHGFAISVHGLRHTHATILLKHGVKIDDVAQRLGHEDISITYKYYRHFLPEDDGGSAETWETSTSLQAPEYKMPPFAA